MTHLIQPSLDDIMYEIKGIRELICRLRFSMVKRSARDDLTTAEDAMKDVDLGFYIAFLQGKNLELYRTARAYGETSIFDETARMNVDTYYVNMLERERGNTPKGVPLYYAILKEIDRVNRKISLYPYTIF